MTKFSSDERSKGSVKLESAVSENSLWGILYRVKNFLEETLANRTSSNLALHSKNHWFSRGPYLERNLKGLKKLSALEVPNSLKTQEGKIEAFCSRTDLNQAGIALLISLPGSEDRKFFRFKSFGSHVKGVHISNLGLSHILKSINIDELHKKDDSGIVEKACILLPGKLLASNIEELFRFNSINQTSIFSLILPEDDGLYLISADNYKELVCFIEEENKELSQFIKNINYLLNKKGLLRRFNPISPDEACSGQYFKEFALELMLILKDSFWRVLRKKFSSDLVDTLDDDFILKKAKNICLDSTPEKLESALLTFSDFLIEQADRCLFEELKRSGALGLIRIVEPENSREFKAESLSEEYEFSRFSKPYKVSDSTAATIEDTLIRGNNNIIGLLFENTSYKLEYRSFSRRLSPEEQRDVLFLRSLINGNANINSTNAVFLLNKGELDFEECKNLCLLANRAPFPVYLLNFTDIYDSPPKFNVYSFRKASEIPACLFDLSIENLVSSTPLGLGRFEAVGLIQKTNAKEEIFDISTSAGSLLELAEKTAGKDLAENKDLVLASLLELKDYWQYPEFLRAIVEACVISKSHLEQVLSKNHSQLRERKADILKSLSKIKEVLGEQELYYSAALLISNHARAEVLAGTDKSLNMNEFKDFLETFRKIYKIAEEFNRNPINKLSEGIYNNFRQIASLYNNFVKITGKSFDIIITSPKLKNIYTDMLSLELLTLAEEVLSELKKIRTSRKTQHELKREDRAKLVALEKELLEPSHRLASFNGLDFIEASLRKKFLADNAFEFRETTFETPKACIYKIDYVELLELQSIAEKYACDFSDLVTNYAETMHRNKSFDLRFLNKAIDAYKNSPGFQLVGIACDPELNKEFDYLSDIGLIIFRA